MKRQLATQKRAEADAIFAKYIDEATGKLRDGVTIDATDLAAIETLEAEIVTLNREADTDEAFEARAIANREAMKASTTVANTLPHPARSTTVSQGLQFSDDATFVIPKNQRRNGRMKAFTGKRTSVQQAEAEAFGFGQWALAAMGDSSARQWCSDNGIELRRNAEKRTMGESSNALGGFLVPSQFESAIIDLKEEYGILRQHVDVITMNRDTASVPRRAGGVTAYWVGESDAITQSDASWDSVGLTAKKLGALAKISNELDEDAIINVGDRIAFEIGYAFAVAEDVAGFIGDGSSTYGQVTGITESLLGLSSTRADIAGLVVGAGNLWSELTLGNFNSVKAKLPVYAQKRAAWYCHNTFYADVMERLALAAGGATAESIINGAAVGRFLGYPVVLTPAMPGVEANDKVACVLGDLSMAVTLGDRRQTTIAFSDSALNAFEKDEIVIRGTERLDIVVHDVGNAHATAASRVPGPVVGLLTAAS